MSLSSSRRGQTDPFVAVLCLFIVVAALGLIVPQFAAPSPESDPDLSRPTLERVHRLVSVAGVVDPASLSTATDAAPTGYRVRASLVADDRRWVVGPRPESGGDAASRPVSVRLDSGVVAGRLGVVVWQ